MLHATTVSIDNKGLLIFGASGAGKSALALQLMAMGANLVADDRTIVERHETRLTARVPETIRGKIEARGLGILNVAYVGSAKLVATVDLDKTTGVRLPEQHFHSVLGIPLVCLHKVQNAHFAASVFFYVKGLTA